MLDLLCPKKQLLTSLSLLACFMFGFFPFPLFFPITLFWQPDTGPGLIPNGTHCAGHHQGHVRQRAGCSGCAWAQHHKGESQLPAVVQSDFCFDDFVKQLKRGQRNRKLQTQVCCWESPSSFTAFKVNDTQHRSRECRGEMDT